MPNRSSVRRIVLTGFMGAGKSTVGRALAQKLGWEFVDVDSVIEFHSGATIAEIFSRQGEPAFRALEAETIQQLSKKEKVVLALGGGALETEATRKMLGSLDDACVVFLEAPLEVLVGRCVAQPGAAARPVLADRERLLRRFESRLPHYRSANVTIATAGLSVHAVVARLLGELEHRGEIAAAEGAASR